MEDVRSQNESREPDQSAPARARTLQLLRRIATPIPIAMLSALGSAAGEDLSAARLRTLLTGERKRFLRDSGGNATWIVPALDATELTPLDGYMTLSDLPDTDRIVGLRTRRVIYLRMMLTLLNMPPGEARDTLLLRCAQTVPDALTVGQPPDFARVQTAVNAELDRIGPLDQAERSAKAAALQRLPGWQRFWGRPILLDSPSAEGVPA